MFSKRIQNLMPSPTFAIDAKVKNLEHGGIRVINLGLGEPDFETPDLIKHAGIKAIEEGFTHYTQAAGIPLLREAIAKKFKNDNNIDYQPQQIVVGAGSKFILYMAFQTLCQKGDEVIVPIPTWNSYVEQVKLSEATPVFIKLHPPFKITAKAIKKKITSRTKVILLNSPSNPTGAMIDEEELNKIASLAVSKNIWIVTDEMYEKIIYGKKHVSIASLNREIYNRTISVNGLSKTYAMTGWRIGYAGGPQEIITVLVDLQSQLTTNASSISQKAALCALEGSEKLYKGMIEEFKARREYLIKSLSSIKDFDVTQPEGSFFFFVGIKKLLGKKYKTSTQWCEDLLQRKQVAVVPGEAFFAPGFFRLSFAADISTLKDAVKKLEEFIYEQ